MNYYQFGLENFIKIYEGAYDYFQKKRKYADETFEIYKDSQNHLFIFKADVSGRAPTGEFLIINVLYKITERFNPIAVSIKKTMGKHITLEEFIFDNAANTMRYKFTSENMLGEINLSTKHKIHVATPAISTSLLFLKSKKFQNAAINNYKTLISDNQWDLDYNLRTEDISVERLSGTPIEIKIKNHHIMAMKYRLTQFEYADVSSKKEATSPNHLDIYLSKHLTIPYKIDDPITGKVLEIRYFNPLEKGEE